MPAGWSIQMVAAFYSMENDSYSLFNARVGLAEIEDRWFVTGCLSNLGIKKYATTIFAVHVTVLQFWSLPRTYGAAARFRF